MRSCGHCRWKKVVPWHELVLLARLLSETPNEDTGNSAEWPFAGTLEAWQALPSARPAYFSIPPEQVRTVARNGIVALAEADTQWFTVAYHLEELLKSASRRFEAAPAPGGRAQ